MRAEAAPVAAPATEPINAPAGPPTSPIRAPLMTPKYAPWRVSTSCVSLISDVPSPCLTRVAASRIAMPPSCSSRRSASYAVLAASSPSNIVTTSSVFIGVPLLGVRPLAFPIVRVQYVHVIEYSLWAVARHLRLGRISVHRSSGAGIYHSRERGAYRLLDSTPVLLLCSKGMFRGTACNQTHRRVETQVVIAPVEHRHNAVAEADELVEMHHQPDRPRHDAGQLER